VCELVFFLTSVLCELVKTSDAHTRRWVRQTAARIGRS